MALALNILNWFRKAPDRSKVFSVNYPADEDGEIQWGKIAAFVALGEALDRAGYIERMTFETSKETSIAYILDLNR